MSPVFHHTSAVPSCGKKRSWYRLDNGKRSKYGGPSPPRAGAEHMWQSESEWRNVKEKSTWQEGRHMTRGAPCMQARKKNKEKSTWREGRHAVLSASFGSREENFRGAKLTAKREENQWTLSNLLHLWYLNKKCRVPLFYNFDFLTCLLYSTTPQ